MRAEPQVSNITVFPLLKKKNGKPIMSIPERTKVHREGKKQRDRKALVTLEVNRTALLDQRVSACGLHQRHPDCG